MSPAAKYPHTNFHFAVEGGGAGIAFEEVELPSMRVHVIEYRHGASPVSSPQLVPGRVSYGRAVLRRGVVPSDDDFYDWFQTIGFGTVERRDVTIKLLDEQHAPVRTWVLRNAFPSKVTTAPLNANGNEILIESLELACEGVTLLK